MKIDNIFLINNWQIKKLLIVVLSVQLALLSLLGLDHLGFQIPILRSFIGFIYLTFIPGMLILRNLRLKNLSSIENILYTIGLSITTLMFTGFIINTFYPIFGILKPLSLQYIIITLSAVVFILSILSYLRDDGHYNKEYLQIENVKMILFLVLIPVLAVVGTYLMNFYNENFLIIFLLVILSLISILSLFKFFKPSLYPLTIFIISIALLYHSSLISMHIWGWDINTEFHFANYVLINSYWDTVLSSDVNAMLSVVILAPIYSYICKLDIIWVFKLIYPFIFSMVPVCLYFITKKYTSSKIAFLSIFYFMAVYIFFCDMMQLARQEIAELFFVLLILLIISSDLDKLKRSILFVLFGVSLIVSHYGLSYIFMFYILSSALILFFVNRYALNISKLVSKFAVYTSRVKLVNISKLFSEFGSKMQFENSKSTLTFNFAIFFVIFGISWYMYVSNSSPFASILNVFNNIYSNIFTDLMDTSTVQGLSIATTTQPLFFHQVNKYLYLLSQFFICIGVVSLFIRKTKFAIEYRILTYLSFLLLIFSLTIPYFSSALQTSRVFQIGLLILSPFFVLGVLEIFNVVKKLTRIRIKDDYVLKMISIFLAVFLLFNSGVVYELSGEIQASISLISLDKSFDYPVFDIPEVTSAEWLSNSYSGNSTIYGDTYRILLLYDYLNKVQVFSEYQDTIQNQSIIYFGSINVQKDAIGYASYSTSSYGTLEYTKLQNLSMANEIYDNQFSRIYLVNNNLNPSFVPVTN